MTKIPGRSEWPILPDVVAWNLALGGRILELGPGNGQLEAPVLAAGGEWVSVDFDPRTEPTLLLDYEINPYELPRGPFDGIFCRNSISTSWRTFTPLMLEINRRMNGGWAWLALWTGKSLRDEVLECIKLMETIGYTHDPSYRRENQVLVTRGLS